MKHVPSLTERNFDEKVFLAPNLVVVSFGADWCGPCVRHMNYLVDDLAREKKGKVDFYEVDVKAREDFYHALNKEYSLNIVSFPSLVAFNNGKALGKLEETRMEAPPKTREEVAAWVAAMEKKAAREPSSLTAVRPLVRIDDSTFEKEVLNTQGFVLLEVYASGRGASEKLRVRDIARKHGDRLKVARLNIEDDSAGILFAFGLVGKENRVEVPALLVFKDGVYRAKLDPKLPWRRMVRQLEGVMDALSTAEAAPVAARLLPGPR